MSLFMGVIFVFSGGVVTGLVISRKMRELQKARRRNSIRVKRILFRPIEIYDLGPDEWREVG